MLSFGMPSIADLMAAMVGKGPNERTHTVELASWFRTMAPDVLTTRCDSGKTVMSLLMCPICGSEFASSF